MTRLDFAEDIALLSSSKDLMQSKLYSLIMYAIQTGLKINAEKNNRNAAQCQ